MQGHLVGFIGCVSLCGCGQVAPPPGLMGDAAAAPVGDSRFPLTDGATWTYRHTDALGVQWDEIAEMKAESFRGETAFRVTDNENPEGSSGQSIMVRRGAQVLRLHTDVMTERGEVVFSVDYDPGFLRWDDSWVDVTAPIAWSHTRTETTPAGEVNSSDMMYEFSVIATNVQVTVPAGTFEAVEVERTRLDTFETKRYWHTSGVGKVREENVTSGGIEELVTFSIP